VFKEGGNGSISCTAGFVIFALESRYWCVSVVKVKVRGYKWPLDILEAESNQN
jgi:hypothetical protein